MAEAVYRAVIEYDGTDFSGFQYQPELRTIAGELETALSRLFDQPIKVTAAGRTDAGVHATGQVISFSGHDAFPVDRLAIALNSALPTDLSARDAARVEPSFSARLSALERFYTYVVLNRPEPSAPARRWAHHEYRSLDIALLERAAADLIGTQDFLSFCGMSPDRGGTVRTLYAIDFLREGDFLLLNFRGAGFLHRMVRTISGTLFEVAAGRRDPGSMPAVLAALDRRAAGPTAPAHGLFLTGVHYPDFSSWRPLRIAASGLLVTH